MTRAGSGALPGGVPGLRRLHPAAQQQGRRLRVEQGLPSRVDPGALDRRVRAGSEVPRGPAAGWLASTSATPIRARCRTSTSGSLLQVVQPGRARSARAGSCSITRATAPDACCPARSTRSASTIVARGRHRSRTQVHANAQLRVDPPPRPDGRRRGALEIGDEQVSCDNSCQTRFAFPVATEAADGLTCRSPRTAAVDAGRDGRSSRAVRRPRWPWREALSERFAGW
jgi:hypothetical protein